MRELGVLALRPCLPVLFGVVLVGCGGGSATTVSPTPTAGPARALILSITDTVRIGQTAQATATSSGMPVTSGFTSDNSAVASVTDDGLVTGVANGKVTISVRAGENEDRQSIRIAPDYQGQWQGTYAVGTCTSSDDYANLDFCGSLTAQVGAGAPVVFRFTQTGVMLTGDFLLGVLESPMFSITLGDDGTAAPAATITTENDTRIEVAGRRLDGHR